MNYLKAIYHPKNVHFLDYKPSLRYMRDWEIWFDLKNMICYFKNHGDLVEMPVGSHFTVYTYIMQMREIMGYEGL